MSPESVSGSWPEVKIQSSTAIAWAYGPMAAGAASVAMEARVLSLILSEEKKTSAFAEALGLDPNASGVERTVKQAKDRILLRMRRLRDDL
jgi:hypothetical protein